MEKKSPQNNVLWRWGSGGRKSEFRYREIRFPLENWQFQSIDLTKSNWKPTFKENSVWTKIKHSSDLADVRSRVYQLPTYLMDGRKWNIIALKDRKACQKVVSINRLLRGTTTNALVSNINYTTLNLIPIGLNVLYIVLLQCTFTIYSVVKTIFLNHWGIS